MKKHTLTGALLGLLLLAGGCRGMESGNTPIHPNPNMDNQERYDPQEPNAMFENGMAMRQPVPGTVAKGFLHEDRRFYSGKTESGHYVEKVPVPVTQALLERGRARFNIYCTPCHGQAGNGKGVIMTGNYGYTPAPTYHKAALRDTADGYLFNVITNGVRNMPAYGPQVPVADRWAIVTYIRALQRSQNAHRENVPPSVLARIEQTGSANMNAARNGPAPANGGASSGGSGGSGGAGSGGAGDESASGGNSASESGASTDTTSAVQSAGGQAAADTASGAGGPATASADTVGGGAAGMDTTSRQTAVAESANASEGNASEGGGTEADGGPSASAGQADGGGTFFGSTFFVLLLVVLPILCLMSLLIVAFRKNSE